MSGLVGHPSEMELRTGSNTFTKKAVKDRRRRRAVEASIMKAQSNLDPVRHSLPSPYPIAKQKT
jgi:hypothetical protein